MTTNEVLEFIYNLFGRLPKIKVTDIFEIIFIAYFIYNVTKWVRGSRAWTLVKGIVVLFFISGIAVIFELNTILWIFQNTMTVGIIAVIIVFQPELRRVLEQLGRREYFSGFALFEDPKDKYEYLSPKSIEGIIRAVNEMAKTKTGALIVVEQDMLLDDFERTGIAINADISYQLLVNIFEHNTPLHDGAIIIRRDKIAAATCYLPLSENMSLSKELGTRHRAAVGVTEVSDSIVIIVSEETGYISMALGGNLIRKVDSEYLKNKLIYVQKKVVDVKKFKLWKGRNRNAKKVNE